MTSRLPGFYRLSLAERRAALTQAADLDATAPIMLGQIQLTHVAEPAAALAAITAHTPAIIARGAALLPRLVERGGGLVAVSARALGDGTGPDGHVVVVHLHVDCRDAMGANLINTLCEALAPALAELAAGRVGLRILSNLTDERLVTAEVEVPVAALHESGAPGTGAEVAEAIAAASRFAELDPYRAATHNKGIMNGVDAALLATGQDWRAVGWTCKVPPTMPSANGMVSVPCSASPRTVQTARGA